MQLKRVSTNRKAVRSAVFETLEKRQLLSATLALVNPAVYPANDRLIFNYIQHPDANVPNVIHDRQSLVISDSGTTPLIISSMVIHGPWQFLNAPVGGYNNITVNPGTPLTISLQFTQRSLPAKSFNETNFTNNTNGGAAITGSLVINSNDAVTPAKTVTLAGYWQNESNSNAEPSLQTIVNMMAGDQTLINATPVPDLSQSNGAQLYGSEVYSTSWSAASTSTPVTVQQIDAFHTQGNSAHLYWYTAATQTSHSLFTEPGNQGQTLLPTLSNGSLATANFNPNGAFGLRVDNEYSNDAINLAAGNSGGGGHHFRFFPLRDTTGNFVPNTYLVAMDYGVLQAENFDFQDNAFIVTNIHPSATPGTPTGLTVTNGAAPTLSWNAVNYSPVSYNVYSSSSLNGTYALLTSTPISGSTTFTDNSNPAGVVYYHVTAVDTTQSPVAESVPASIFANGGPVAVGYTFNAFGGQSVTFNPLVSDTDATGTLDPATVNVSNPNHGGTATVDHSTGLITYTPTNNFSGTETFTYTVADNNATTSSPATITFKVTTPSVSSPVANNLVATTLEGTAVQIPILNVDLPVTSFDLTSIIITTATTHGSTVINSDGTVTYTPTGTFVGGDEFRYTVKDSNGQTSNVGIVDINSGVELNSAKGGNHTLNYTDQNGTPVTVTLSKGIADVFFDGNGASAASKKGKVIVTGSSLHIREIALSGTTKASTLSITGKKNGAVNLGGIVDSDPMGTISAKTSTLTSTAGSSAAAIFFGNFTGEINLPGTLVASPAATVATTVVPSGTINLAGVHSILLKGVSSGVIDLGNSGTAATTVSISGAVTDSSLTSSVPLTALKAKSWTNTKNNPITIFAPSIASLVIGGEFDPDLTLSGGVKPTTIASAKITGQVNDGAWSIAGNVKSLSVGSANSAWGGLNVTGLLSSFTVKAGTLAADISAGSITSMRVVGALAANVTTSGNIASLVVGSLSGATVTAGVSSGTAVDTATTGQLGSSVIKSVRVTSHLANAFSNSQIMASSIKSASLGAVNTTNGGVPEGLAAITVSSVTAKTGGVTLHLGKKQLADEATLAAYVASKGISFGDFTINLAQANG